MTVESHKKGESRTFNPPTPIDGRMVATSGCGCGGHRAGHALGMGTLTNREIKLPCCRDPRPCLKPPSSSPPPRAARRQTGGISSGVLRRCWGGNRAYCITVMMCGKRTEEGEYKKEALITDSMSLSGATDRNVPHAGGVFMELNNREPCHSPYTCMSALSLAR